MKTFDNYYKTFKDSKVNFPEIKLNTFKLFINYKGANAPINTVKTYTSLNEVYSIVNKLNKLNHSTSYDISMLVYSRYHLLYN